MGRSAALRKLIDSGKTTIAPGAYDGISARLVEQAGFSAVYAGGEAISRSAGLPDVGLLGMSAIVDRLEQMVEATTVPLIADAGSAWGSVAMVQRAVRAFERAGVAAFQLGDQTIPKRYGHGSDKALVPMPEMVQKLRAVRDAARDPELVIVARTEALVTEGFEAAIIRAEAYREAGADVLFVEAPHSEEQLAEMARRLPCPKLIDLDAGSKTPPLPPEHLEELGYSIVIISGDLQRAALRAMRDTLEVIRRDGSSGAIRDRLLGAQDVEELVETASCLAQEKTYGG